jgi:hypothetical protein
MLFDGLLIEHQCRPQAVAAAGTSGTIVYRNLFLSSLLGRPIQCLSLPIIEHNSNRLAIYCFVGLNLLRCEHLCSPQSIGGLYIHIRFHTSPIRVRHRQDSSWGYLTEGRLRVVIS